MTVSLRPATPADLDAVTDLHVTVWRATYAHIAPPEAIERLDHAHRRESWVRTLGDPARGTLLARSGGTLAGLVSFGPPGHAMFGTAGEIKHLYVAAPFRQTGLGRRLLTAGRQDHRALHRSRADLAVGQPVDRLAGLSHERLCG